MTPKLRWKKYWSIDRSKKNTENEETVQKFKFYLLTVESRRWYKWTKFIVNLRLDMKRIFLIGLQMPNDPREAAIKLQLTTDGWLIVEYCLSTKWNIYYCTSPKRNCCCCRRHLCYTRPQHQTLNVIVCVFSVYFATIRIHNTIRILELKL